MTAIRLPEPPLSSGGLVLRRWLDVDVHARVQAGHDPGILKYTSVPARPRLAEAVGWIREQDRQLLEGLSAYMAIAIPGTSHAVGSIGLIKIDWHHLRAEVGYWVLPDYRKQGLASMALNLVASWAFAHLGIIRLELFANLDNYGTQAVASKCHFTREGMLRSYGMGRYGREDLFVYSRLSSD